MRTCQTSKSMSESDEVPLRVNRSTIYRSGNESKVEREQFIHNASIREQKVKRTNEDDDCEEKKESTQKQTHRYCILHSEIEKGIYNCFNCHTEIEITDIQRDQDKLKFFPTKKHPQTGLFYVQFIPHCSELCAWHTMSRRHDSSKIRILFVEMYGKTYNPKPRELLFLPPSQRISKEKYVNECHADVVEVCQKIENMSKRPLLAPIEILQTTVDRVTLKPTAMITSEIDEYYHIDVDATVDVGVIDYDQTQHNSSETDQKVIEDKEVIYIQTTPRNETVMDTALLKQVAKRRKITEDTSTNANANAMQDDIEDID